jgi:hypothetical protein
MPIGMHPIKAFFKLVCHIHKCVAYFLFPFESETFSEVAMEKNVTCPPVADFLVVDAFSFLFGEIGSICRWNELILQNTYLVTASWPT